MSNALKALLLLFPISAPAAELFLTWDFESEGWQDGYRVYCSQNGETNEPISVTEREIRLSALNLQEGATVRIMEAWKRFRATLSRSHTFSRVKSYYLQLRGLLRSAGSKERRVPSPALLQWVAIIVYCVIVFAIIAYIIWE